MISVALPLIALFILLRFVVRRIRQAKRLISDHNGMKKISANPSIFGGNAGKTWFYDDQFLYEVKNNATRKIALATIIKIGPRIRQFITQSPNPLHGIQQAGRRFVCAV